MITADTSPVPPPFFALHSRPPISFETCQAAFTHNKVGEILSLLIAGGLVLSYLPQHYRIIASKNSEGFSPLFLLLGATSSASSLANIVTLQWGQVACCQYLSAGQCFESVLGIVQVFVQWSCFNLIFVLYLLYYPLSSKYVRSVPIPTSSLPSSHRKPRGLLNSLIPKSMRSTTSGLYIRQSLSSDSLATAGSDSDEEDTSADEGAGRRTGTRGSFDPRSYLLPGQLARGEIILSSEYRHAVSLFLLTLLHLLLTFLTTFILLYTLPKAEVPHPHPSPIPGPGEPGNGGEGDDGSGSGSGSGGSGREHPQERAVRVWAATLGFVSLGLACVQYAPQLVLTARRRLVGSLSIPMMLLQTPGSFLFVYTLAIRPSVNYTAWLTYFVTGLLQGTLLILCLIYRRRQKREGVDDWGKPIEGEDGEVSGGFERRREGTGRAERSRLLE
ncbi:hypothetical protein JCM11251_002559 [Rhodosporidiobolus azoricus]